MQNVLDRKDLECMIAALISKYHAERALLFGSYARGEATADSDIDLVVYGGPAFRHTDIFALAEELYELSGKRVDIYEIQELTVGTPFYDSVMEEGVEVA